MAKKATDKLTPGTKIRVKEGVVAPEMPAVSIGGWTGMIVELSGPKANPKFIVEWDDATIAKIPEAYRTSCEQQGLLFSMACLTRDDLEC